MSPARVVRAALVAALVGWAARAAIAATAGTHVGYLAGGSVYVESGRLDGIHEGDTLTVVRDGAVLGRLIVRYLSSHRASCDTLAIAALPRVGDVVRFTPHAAAPDTLARAPAVAAGGTTPVAPPTVAPKPGPRRLRGRIGASWLALEAQGGAGYSQPAVDMRLDARNPAMDAAVDVRSHRTYLAGTNDYQDLGRVYRMSLSLHDWAGSRSVTVGRQISPSLAAVSLFDGALASLSAPRWGAGLFAGSQPDPVRYRLSTDIVESGGYAEWRSRPLSERRWSITGGGIASFDHGNANRNYMFIQSFYTDRRVSGVLSQEIDFYPSWARALGEPAISPSSTFLTARMQATPKLSLDAGYDTRRNVRLYRDRVTPETEFDDRYRDGVWLGAAYEPGTHVRLSADGRHGSGGDGGNYHTWTASAEAFRVTPLQADVRLRASRFVGDLSTEWLDAAGLTFRTIGQTQFGLDAGVRTSTDVLSQVETRIVWQSVDLNMGLARNWYLMFSGDHDHGDTLDQVQTYAGLSWLF